ncbi:MAG: class I SAM-dependent methyltransferase [Candidatus Caldarchaeum sp.]
MAVLDYDRLSDCYDELYGEEQLSKYRAAVNMVGHLEFSCVLDVGCGTGLFLRFLREKGWTSEYVGVDVSSGMLAKALEKADASSHVVMADAHHLPFRDNAFPILFSFTVLHHLNTSQFLAEASRVCGKLMVVTQHKRLSPRLENNVCDSETVDEILVGEPSVFRKAADSCGTYSLP